MNLDTVQGVLCMNKPTEFTSFDVIGKLRGILHMRRLGHTGTLDPMATGVLPVLVGKATRACDIRLGDRHRRCVGNPDSGVSGDARDKGNAGRSNSPVSGRDPADPAHVFGGLRRGKAAL